jgi:GNAT superfamily N-acetyltransferase
VPALPAPLTIRPAAPADIPHLLAMARRWAESHGATDSISATEADWFKDGFGPLPRFTALIAEMNGLTVGMAVFSDLYLADVGKTCFYVSLLYVEPPFRRLGIARTLLGYIAALAQKVGVPVLQLGVTASNPATALYDTLGWQRAVGYVTYILAGSQLYDLAAWAAELLGLT